MLSDFFWPSRKGERGDRGDRGEAGSGGRRFGEFGTVSAARESSLERTEPPSASGCGTGLRPIVSSCRAILPDAQPGHLANDGAWVPQVGREGGR